MKNILILILAFTFLNSFYTHAQKHVDLYRGGTFFKSYSTIDEAIRSANITDDSLVLSADTFFENRLNGRYKYLTYTGTISGGDTTTIDGGSADNILLVSSRGFIKDIILQNSKSNAIAIYNTGYPKDTFKIKGHSIIRNCINLDNKTELIYSAGNLVIEDNTKIVNNVCNSYFLKGHLSNCSLKLKDSVIISNNHINFPYYSYHDSSIQCLIQLTDSLCTIEDNVQITNNTADSGLNAGILITFRKKGNYKLIGDSVKISGNKVLNGPSKGSINIINPYDLYMTGYTTATTFTLGKIVLEGNEAGLGGAIYCVDSTVTIELNGTTFRNNKATKGGAIYTKGSLKINNANFENNSADTANSIYINSAMSDSVSPIITVKNTRFYNSTLPANKQNHIYATYTPLTAMPPMISFNGNWWGKSDTIGVLRDKPKGYFPIYTWAQAYWAVNKGITVSSKDSTFPVSASIKHNTGALFPSNSFSMLQGTFTTDTGVFTPPVVAINSSNEVISTYHTFKDSVSKSTNANFLAWIDADTFRKVQIVWSNDTSNGVSVKEVRHINAYIYPNPASDFVIVDGLESSVYKIDIFSFEGKKCIASVQYNNGKYHVDVSTLAPGNYILQISNSSTRVGKASFVKR